MKNPRFRCGTGTHLLMIKKEQPGSSVYWIDIDPEVLEIAEKKVRGEGVDVHLMKYDGVTLPFADGNFDKVVTSFVLHHLSTEEKIAVFRELFRVLKTTGTFHILDFGVQRSVYTRLMTSVLGLLEPIEDNLLGKIPEFLARAGFQDAEEVHFENTLLGTVSFYRSKKI